MAAPPCGAGQQAGAPAEVVDATSDAPPRDEDAPPSAAAEVADCLPGSLLPPAVPNGAVGDWRLAQGDAFLASFHKPGAADKHEALAQLHPYPRDTRIVFDEEAHTYTIDGEHVVHCSITKLLHLFSEPFNDAAAVACMKRSRKRPWAERQREEFTREDGTVMTDAEILESWRRNGEEQSARGVLMHWHIEMTLNGRSVEEPHSPEYQQFLAFRRELMEPQGWKPWRTEMSIFHTGLGVAGQVDCLCRDAQGHLVILDWKRSKQINMEGYRRLRAPFAHLADCNYELYSMQLNLYRAILEEEYGERVSCMYLGVFHPTQDRPVAIRVRRMDVEVAALHAWAREHMGAGAPNAAADAPFVARAPPAGAARAH